MAYPGFAKEDKSGIVTFAVYPSSESSPVDGVQFREALNGRDMYQRLVWQWTIGNHRIWQRVILDGISKTHFEALRPFFRNRRCLYLPDTDVADTAYVVKFLGVRWHMENENDKIYQLELSFEEIA